MENMEGKTFVAVGYYHDLGAGPLCDVAYYEFFTSVKDALESIDIDDFPEDENEESEVDIQIFRFGEKERETLDLDIINGENYEETIGDFTKTAAEIDERRERNGEINDTIPENIWFCRNIDCLCFHLTEKCSYCNEPCRKLY